MSTVRSVTVLDIFTVFLASAGTARVRELCSAPLVQAVGLSANGVTVLPRSPFVGVGSSLSTHWSRCARPVQEARSSAQVARRLSLSGAHSAKVQSMLLHARIARERTKYHVYHVMAMVGWRVIGCIPLNLCRLQIFGLNTKS